MIDILFRDLESLSGIGPFFLKLIKDLCCGSRFIDLLLYFPNSYNKRKVINHIREIVDGEVFTVKVNVGKCDFKNNGISKVFVEFDDVESIEIIYFKANKQYLERLYRPGQIKWVSGKIAKSGYKWQIIHPDYVVNDDRFSDIPEIEQTYGLTKGINNRMIVSLVSQIIKQIEAFKLPEWFDKDCVKSNSWLSFLDSMKVIHNLNSDNQKFLIKAKERIIFDELFASQIGLKLLRISYKSYKGRSVKGNEKYRKKVLENLSFNLTNDQKQASKEIYDDQADGLKMVRMLQGDVGSGKTIVALMAMLNVIECGLQAVLMVPTEILAQQHFESITKILAQSSIDMKIGLLTSSVKKKKKILEEIANNEYQIIIGTHALFQDKVKFQNIGLIVIDEQHRFGVNHRAMLSSKDEFADLLFMSATPIPRSLSMVQYGYMDNSLIVEKPKDRLPIVTSIVSNNQLQEVLKKIGEFIGRNEKVYWICPLIEESLKLEYIAIEKRAELLFQYFSDKLAIIHGRMKDKEIDNIMRMFSGKEFDKDLLLTESECKDLIAKINYSGCNKQILLSTTLVEVGVNIPEASLIVIEDAQKFGLSQLHQLRGRVGRSGVQSYCILIYNPQNITKTGRSRLQVLKESNDGFYIAEQDLKIRGGGELVGMRQSGYDTYKVANIAEHAQLLQRASVLAYDLAKRYEVFERLPDEIKNLLKIFNVSGVSGGYF
jgi:ATP-dependent DNA helicase RecG